jgi:hypothetical protein
MALSTWSGSWAEVRADGADGAALAANDVATRAAVANSVAMIERFLRT